MISLNSLAAFTAEVTRSAGIAAPAAAPATAAVGRAPPPAAPGADPIRDAASAPTQQRTLDTVPASPPAKPLPRGSLLDLRV